MRIKCPECESVLSFTLPKTGSYQPKCKHCGKAFWLKVSSDDPPKIGFGRLKANSPQKPESTKPATTTTPDHTPTDVKRASNTAATFDGTDATVDAGSTKAGTVSQGSSQDIVVKSGTSDSSVSEMPAKLGGYRIVRLLGRGAMGAVYEAQQVSLDRQVALKTIRDRLAGNPASLARFIREAYAAAQLTHHNVVQIYDFGEDAGRHYFSMEWVRGGPLDAVVRQKGSLDPRLAAGYILQAARGLQFAHRHGMVHRDIKPSNLLLSDDGVVKVADLGLVKIPDQADIESITASTSRSGPLASGTEVTMQGTAVGTPAFMAPEQTIDAANVDSRADIYSLGCTLFYLLTGRPPFDGPVATEVMQQHAEQAPPDITKINSRIPEPLAKIVNRSIAKQPADRYPSLVECIADLEQFLGLSTEGDFSPSSDQADQWEQIAATYGQAAAPRRLQAPLFYAAAGGAIVLTLLSFGLGFAWWIMGTVMFAVTIVTVLTLDSHQSAIVARIRSWTGTLSLIDWIAAGIGGVLFLLMIVVAGLWTGGLAGAIIGLALGAAYHFGLVASTEKRCNEPLQNAQRFVRNLRIDGADENGLRSFAARYAGGRWQDLFERLFGYDSLIQMRQILRQDPSFTGPTAGFGIRDRVCANLAARAKANRQPDLQKRLAKVERLGLQSEGMSVSEAEQRSWALAEAIMKSAQVAPLQAGADAVNARAATEAKRNQMKAMLADARSGKYKSKRDKFAPLRFAIGGPTRLIIGCGLLAVFAVWGNHQGMFDSIKDIETLKKIGTGSANFDQLGSAVRDAAATANQTVEGSTFMGSNISPWSVGIAGLLMAMSAFVAGWRMSLPASIATIVILIGPALGIPAISELIPAWITAAGIGVIIYIPGILFGEK
ncbi:serine/threonine protein kinase [Rubripirellula reticaptiva]|uniref:Serine/threonine-protein kinase PknB n=1 Tax=Rubripirellula reticaptiva TaxID=2528013 RepID=A0A5C6F850_9BACT|nr:serine/threonine-protein kinase [Rubripirellula reticaptiva]TWU57913.1 Serine/threonine-protein kinase PknB [Rubripirellula reticaptiva]